MICSGNAAKGTSPVGFSESGDVLHFFGETLYISRDDVMGVLSYPSRAAEFCMRFLPMSVSTYVRIAAKSLSSGFRELLSLLIGALDTFLTLGTDL